MRVSRSTIVSALILGVVSAGLASLSSTSAGAVEEPATPATGLLRAMRAEADGPVRLSSDAATGRLSFARAAARGDLLPEWDGRADPAGKATAYLRRFAPAFGAQAGELLRESVVRSAYGTTVTYTQAHEGIPVYGAMLRAQVDPAGDLTSVNGQAVPTSRVPAAATVGAPEAARHALALVRSDPPTDANDAPADTTGLAALSTRLVVYRVGLARGVPGDTDLAYQVEVGNRADVRDLVFVSATTGKPLNRYSMVDSALGRELYEQAFDPAHLVWQEGDPFPGDLTGDQANMVSSTGEAYWFFDNAFGRDSYDGDGATMRTVNNDPRIRCPNANWNGVTTNYCDGVSSDDVVAHEWGHAYTEYTHGLIYQWQPGALNESYSDIWGETIDLVNGRQDEGEGDLERKRPVGRCSAHTPDIPLLTINGPASIAKDCLTGGLLGPGIDEPITGDVVAPTDAAETGGTTTDGCSPYDDPAAAAGKIVLVDRGLCAFVQKAQVAKAAGVLAVVIGNRDNAPVSFSSADTTLPVTVSIGLSDRETIRATLAAGHSVNVTISDAGGSDRTDSYRWLIGEKSGAFGSAIRDMWTPTCEADPGKVTDAEYACSTADGGGVHSNSGVPNHGYALLVDGGTYNGHAVRGIGLTKAAAIYYRAMTAYQTPASKFPDHADALAASCADLTGKAIKELSTAPRTSQTSQQRVTAGDCAQVAAMAAAVELRVDPARQCDYGPLLDPDAPPLCGPGTAEDVVWSESFEDGLADWTLAGENPYGGPTADWRSDSTLPAGNDTRGAYGPAPKRGQCNQDSTDFSSVNTMTSAPIVVGDAAGRAPRLSFRHSVATELDVDGGNLQLSVNGGGFAPVPASAYLFNAPGTLLTAAAGNTNPLAGQPAFSGTDEGEVFGSWGQSQVDLAAAGVEPGDTVSLRFAIGRDGCGGVDGWYVDDVKVVLCKPAATVTAAHRPDPSRYGRASTVVVTVTGSEPAPTGTVTLSRLGGAALGTKPLPESGTVSFGLPRTFRIGATTLVAAYSGDDTYGPARDRVVVHVKARSNTVAEAPWTVRQGRAFVARVWVRAAGVRPTGRVRVRTGGVVVGSAQLSRGTARVGIDRTFSVGTHWFTATYQGSATLLPSSDRFRLRVTG